MESKHQPGIAESMLPKDQIVAIGLLAAEWEYVESTLENLIWLLAKIPSHMGSCLTTHADSRARADMLRTLGTETLTDLHLKEEIDAICSALERLRTKRDDFLRSIWFRPLSGLLQTADPRGEPPGKIDIRATPQSVNEIRKVTSAMTDLTAAVAAVISKLQKPAQASEMR